jgi:large subunit ribosomal protein L32
MALQKRRLGRTRIHHRRSAWMASMKKPLVGSGPNCGEPRLPHRVCMKCGQYRGEAIFEGAEEETE